MKYSIITINYNNRDGLERTIQSVINQTCQDFEYIIIDGGSTDGSVDVIKKYADKIDYWVSEPDKGIYNAMNKGILQAHGDYLNFMNSGDCFYDEKVLSTILLHCQNDIIIGRVCNVNNNGDIFSYSIEAKQMTMFHFFISTLPHQGCFIKKSLFEHALYDESLNIVSDWKFFMNCIVNNDCSYTKTSLVIAKCEPRGASSNFDELLMEKEHVLKEYLFPGIYNDYKHLSLLGVDLYNYIIYITQSETLRRICYYLIKLIVSIHHILFRNKGRCS